VPARQQAPDRHDHDQIAHRCVAEEAPSPSPGTLHCPPDLYRELRANVEVPCVPGSVLQGYLGVHDSGVQHAHVIAARGTAASGPETCLQARGTVRCQHTWAQGGMRSTAAGSYGKHTPRFDPWQPTQGM
jgi:hypothetical protein